MKMGPQPTGNMHINQISNRDIALNSVCQNIIQFTFVETFYGFLKKHIYIDSGRFLGNEMRLGPRPTETPLFTMGWLKSSVCQSFATIAKCPRIPHCPLCAIPMTGPAQPKTTNCIYTQYTHMFIYAHIYIYTYAHNYIQFQRECICSISGYCVHE